MLMDSFREVWSYYKTIKHPYVRAVVKFVTTDGIEIISLFNDALNRALHSLLSNEKTMDIVY